MHVLNFCCNEVLRNHGIGEIFGKSIKALPSCIDYKKIIKNFVIALTFVDDTY
jgi:hypothetical protein